MKKAISMFGLVAVLFITIGLATVSKAADEAKTMTWTGWISDSHCGAKGMSADHKSCAMACIKKGSQWVFVNGADKTVLTIDNQDAVSGDKDLGQQVTVTGHVTDKGALHVDSIAKSS
jgi:hypothetical protein